MAEGGEPKNRVQYCLHPNYFEHFLYFRAIHGHSGGTLVDPSLKDNLLLPNDFAEDIYFVGNAHDIHSVIQGGLISGGSSLKRDRPSVFFTAVNPMYANQDLEEVQYEQDKPRIKVSKNTWRVHQNTVYWCNLKLAQKKRIAVLSSTIPRNRCLQHTIWRGFILQRIPISKVTKSRTHAKICNMDVRILLISKRENPPTIKANKARSTGKLVAHISRTHVASISKKITERSTRKLVAVTLITEFKVYLTQPSRKKTRIAQGNRQKTDSTVRESPEP